MAEIKSTMDMVLERAEKLAAAASGPVDNEDLLRNGMRLAADYLNKKATNLTEELSKQPENDQRDIRKGMTKTLLRNIVLPRDEELQASGALALQGIQELSENKTEVQSICQELGQILEQYSQHKEQTTQQLEDALVAQLEQQQMASGQESSGKPNPAMHPQYQEELTKMLTSLNGQYNDAMDQRKDLILNQLS